MARYDIYLLLHIIGAIVWLGGGLVMNVQAARAMRSREEAAIRTLFDDVVAIGNTLFVPASLLVLAMGILMVADGPWQFDQLWIVLALAGFGATFLTGTLIMKPSADRIHAMIERDGGMSPEAVGETRKLLIKGRADEVVLYLVVVVMVAKPTGEDVALLAVLAAVIVAAIGYVATAVRGVDLPRATAGAGA